MNHVTYISAGAGSGKTFTLTSILADLIINKKAEPEQFILTTFTEAAAAEFKEKAKAKLYDQKTVKKYAEYAERLDQAMIGTIDSVAYSFVQRYWYLLGISPNLKMMDDEQKTFFIGQILTTIATEQETAFLKDFCEQFNITFDYNSGKYGLNYDFWKDDVKSIFEKSKSFGVKDFAESKKKSLEFAKSITEVDEVSINFGDIFGVLDEIEDIYDDIKNTAKGKKPKDITSDIKYYRYVFSKTIKICDLLSFKDFLEGLRSEYHEDTAVDSIINELDSLYTSRKVQDLVLDYIELIFKFVELSQAAFDEYKNKQHLIDFADMEVYFIELLGKKEVQEDIKNKFKYVFVDEFQDSSPIQVEIFEKLSDIVGNDSDDDYVVTVGTEENAKKFKTHNSIWVGDFKQAIYGFRGADTDLTKAVADIITSREKKNPKAYSSDTLKSSFRSLEGIVEFTNSIFVKAFEGVLEPEQVKLEAPRGNPDKIKSLKCWKMSGSNKDLQMENLALQIAKRLKDGEKPSDYAVLARGNSDLNKLSEKLKALNVPVCRTLTIDEDRDEYTLLSAILNIVINESDNYSRAVVAFLSQEGFYAGDVIDSKLEYDKARKEASENEEEKFPLYLAENPILQKIHERISFYKLQTVHNLVETLVVELDLITVAHKWENNSGSTEVFQALIEAAYSYEEQCKQMGLPPTISGYLEFCTENTTSEGTKDGVTLDTFHGSKGLEWKKVILLNLDYDAEDEKSIFKYDVFGVQNYHDVAPSESELFPPMIINLMPVLFTGNRNVAGEMADRIRGSARFEEICRTSKSELIRLMYVAITRARDELILIQNDKDPFKVFEFLKNPVSEDYEFEPEKLAEPFGKNIKVLCEDKALEEGEVYNSEDFKQVILKSETKAELSPRDMQPSKAPSDKKVQAKEVFNSGRKITINALNNEYDLIGTCIHEVYSFIERNKDEKTVAKIIKNSGMEKQIPNPKEVLDAWNNLEEYLVKTYGEGKTAHEVPFKHFYEGQIYTGNIDLAWETKNGVVLVDYKTFGGTIKDALDQNNAKHYVGNYKGQFECYERALTAAGKKVIAKLVYYATLGSVVEI